MASSNEYFTPERIDEQIEQLRQAELLNDSTNEAHLVNRLQRHYQARLFAEDRAALEHARQRLLNVQSRGETLEDYPEPVVAIPITRPVVHPGRTRLMRVLSSLAAVILVGTLIGGWVAVTRMVGTRSAVSPGRPENLYVVQNGIAYHLDGSNGRVIWQDRLSTSQPSGSANLQVVNSVVYVVLDFDVYALNASSGEQIWHVGNHTKKAYFWFMVENGRVYLYSLDGTFSALNAANGSELWHNTTFTTENGYGFHVFDGNLYTQSSGGNQGTRLYTLDGATGQIRWSWPLSNDSLLSTLLVKNGVVYFSAADFFYALKEQSGEKIWEQTLSGGAFEMSPDGGVLYVNSPEGILLPAYPATVSPPDVGNIFALDAQTGRRLWTSDPGYNTLHLPLTHGLLMATRLHNRIYTIVGLNPRTGKVAWQAPFQCATAEDFPTCSSSWAAVINGQLYLLESASPQQNRTVYTLNILDPATGQLLSAHQLTMGQDTVEGIGVSNGLLYCLNGISKTANELPYTDYVFAAYRLSDGALAWSHAMPPFPPPTSADTMPNTSQPVLAP